MKKVFCAIIAILAIATTVDAQSTTYPKKCILLSSTAKMTERSADVVMMQGVIPSQTPIGDGLGGYNDRFRLVQVAPLDKSSLPFWAVVEINLLYEGLKKDDYVWVQVERYRQTPVAIPGNPRAKFIEQAAEPVYAKITRIASEGD